MTVTLLESRINRNWRDLAACRGASDAELFPEDPADDSAKRRYCRGCPVTQECLDLALATGSDAGTWGGLTEAERAGLAYSQTNCHDWQLELQDLQARSTHEERRTYRLKLGQLYCQGVSIQELLAGGAPNDRMIWRGIREYREAS